MAAFPDYLWIVVCSVFLSVFAAFGIGRVSPPCVVSFLQRLIFGTPKKQ